MTWDPERYLRFSARRERPALDLLNRIPPVAAARVWDLGCGPGSLTRRLAARWPSAAVFGLDKSREMLERARQIDGIAWVQGDIATWEPDEPADVIFANASLHWVDDHDRLFPRLMQCLAPGGVLAVQMPRNFGEPSHCVLYETARERRWTGRVGHLAGWTPVDEPDVYYRRIAPHATTFDLWETVYVHILEGRDAVARWVEGSAARPFLSELGEEAEDFLAEYAERLRPHYPNAADGKILFPFRRMFMVTTR